LGGSRLIKNSRDFVIQVITSVILIVTGFLPNDRYILKIAGLLIFNIVLFKDNIKNLLSKLSKKDNE